MTFMKQFQLQAVIFDFDGVIVDTEPLHYRAFQEVLIPLGLGFSWEEYVETYMGFDDRDAFREAFRVKDLFIDHQKLARLIDRKASIFQKIIREGITPYPGVVELVGKLRAAHLPLAICSGALRSDITPILDTLKIGDCFDVIVTAEDVARSKPDPECYRVAFARLRETRQETEFSPATTYAIEDTPAGISSASRAGLRVIAVTNSYSRDHLTEAGRIVNSLEQLLDITP